MDPLHSAQQFENTAELPTELSASSSDAAAKARHQRLFQRGLRWLGAGIAMMALSFSLNLLFHDSGDSIVTSMYVLTGIGTVAITKGLVDILGF